MAFLNITDPKRRDEIVNDYFQTIDELRKKADDERANGLVQQAKLETHFKPIISATKEVTREIQKQAAPAKEKEIRTEWDANSSLPAYNFYEKIRLNRDKYYGIQKVGNEFRMGKEIVNIDKSSNISIDGETLTGTAGLWALIMLNKPHNYTDKDLENYKLLVSYTSVIDNPIIRNKTDKPTTTLKFRNLLSKFEEESETESENEVDQKPETSGKGVSFLPSNISGLLSRFRYLTASRQSGNIKATTGELVAILDELLRQKYLTREQYNNMCE